MSGRGIGEIACALGLGALPVAGAAWLQAGRVDQGAWLLATMVSSGQVTATTLVWHEGFAQWTPAGQVNELGEFFKKVPPPLPRRARA